MMAKPVWAGFVIAIVLGLICTGIYAFIEHSNIAQATLSEVSTIVGVDTNTTGNSATYVGTIDRCVSVSPNNTFDIDLFVKDVTNLNKFEGTFSFDESVVQVNSLTTDGFLLGSSTYGPIFQCYPDPDGNDGECSVGTFDTTGAGHPGSGVPGSGVLGRLHLTALSAGTSRLYFTRWPLGVSAITLEDNGNPPAAIGDIPAYGDLKGDRFFDGLVFNAIVKVAVGQPCPTDADLDGFTNVEESVDGSDLLNAASTPEMCDVDGEGEGVDNDLDGLTNEWYDRDPVNGTPDCVDPASDSDDDGTHNPTDTDDDNDRWPDRGNPVAGRASEAYLGTDSLADCPVNAYHSAWPLDINNNGIINLAGDVANFAGKIGTAYGDGIFRRRLDLNGDHVINLSGDVAKYVGHIGDGCS
jgi:hypothetical protein